MQPYVANPDIDSKNEYQLSKRVLLTPGDKFKVSGEWGSTFIFVRHAWNMALGTEWIDCIDTKLKQMRSFRPDAITRRVR